jgi:hypothetical protein
MLISEAARIWTAVKQRPDGDPTEDINTPARLFSPYPTKIPLFVFSEFLFQVLLALSLHSLSVCALISHSRIMSAVSS